MESKKLIVAECFAQYDQGCRTQYDSLVVTLSNPDIEDGEVSSLLDQLKVHISSLGREHVDIVSSILNMKWVNRSNRSVRDYQSFIVNLVTSNTIHLRPAVRMIVKQFLPSNPDTVDVTERSAINDSFQHLHRLLNTILKLVPMTPTVLMPVLSDCIPIIYKNSYVHECYINNLFQLLTYLQQYRLTILQIIINHLTTLDKPPVLDYRTPLTDEEFAEAKIRWVKKYNVKKPPKMAEPYY